MLSRQIGTGKWIEMNYNVMLVMINNKQRQTMIHAISILWQVIQLISPFDINIWYFLKAT